MKKKLFFTLSLFFVFNFGAALAQNVKIGVVDENYIMATIAESRSAKYETAQGNVQVYGKKLEEEYMRKVQELQDKAAGYEASLATMTQEGVNTAREELAKMERDIQTFQQDAQLLLRQKESQELEPIFRDIQEAINNVVQESGYSHVFRKEMLLYEPEGSDISDAVLTKMGITPKR